MDLPLLERDHEVAVLDEALANAAQGEGGVVLVQAPAGAGKTRLLRYARETARDASMRVLAARGSELETVYPFGVVRQLFDPVMAGANGGKDLFVDAAAPAAQVLGGAPKSESALDITGAVHALYWLTVRVADDGPLLVAVDDAHWADRPSLRFVSHLARRLDGLPVLLVAVARSSEPGGEPEEWSALAGDPAAIMVSPNPLSEAASAALVRRMLGHEAADAFCAACWRATGGNPLFLRELLTALRRADVTPSAEAADTVAAVGPPAIARFVLHRLHRLGEQATALAEAVSVAGEVELRLAAKIAGVDPPLAPQLAEALAEADILRGVGQPEFVHPLTRAAVYESLPAAKRATLHAITADALVEAGAAPEQVAGHLLGVPPAGDRSRVATLREAAAVARARGDPADAASYLRRALAEPPAESEVAEMQLETAWAEQASHQFESADARTRALVQGHADVEVRVQAAEGLARAAVATGRAQAVIEPLRRLAEELADASDPNILAAEKALVMIARTDPEQRELAARWLARFVRDAEGDPRYAPVAAAYVAHEAAMANRPYEEVRAAARAALASGQLPAGEPATYVAIVTLRLAEDLETLGPRLDRNLGVARSQGNGVAAVLTLAERALLSLARGSLASAQTDAEAGLELVEAQHMAAPLLACALIETAIEQGDLDRGDRLASRHPPAEALFFNDYLVSRAHLRVAQERFVEGLEDALEAGQHIAGRGRSQVPTPPWRGVAALAARATGDRERAYSLAAEQLELARAFGAPIALGRALRVAGRVIGDIEGLRLCEESVAVLEQSPGRLEFAHALYELGAAQIRMRHRREAREPLRRAILLARDCGASRLATQAEAELRSGGGRPPRFEQTGLEALTPAERRVAELAAEGKTNREIAQTLFVTEKTVELHLTSVYRKLGIRSRWQLSGALLEPVSA